MRSERVFYEFARRLAKAPETTSNIRIPVILATLGTVIQEGIKNCLERSSTALFKNENGVEISVSKDFLTLFKVYT